MPKFNVSWLQMTRQSRVIEAETSESALEIAEQTANTEPVDFIDIPEYDFFFAEQLPEEENTDAKI